MYMVIERRIISKEQQREQKANIFAPEVEEQESQSHGSGSLLYVTSV